MSNYQKSNPPLLPQVNDLWACLSSAVFNKELFTVKGGHFELGFISAFTSSLALSYTTGKSNNPLAIMGIGAAIGGTAEALGGGKFANGAVTGAFVGLFNHGMHLEQDDLVEKEIYRQTTLEEVSVNAAFPYGDIGTGATFSFQISVTKIRIGVYRNGRLIDSYYNFEIQGTSSSTLNPDIGKVSGSADVIFEVNSKPLQQKKFTVNSGISTLQATNTHFLGTIYYNNIEMGATYTVAFTGRWSVKTDVGNFSPTIWGGTGAKAKTYITIY